jgi:hypothetical protein
VKIQSFVFAIINMLIIESLRIYIKIEMVKKDDLYRIKELKDG